MPRPATTPLAVAATALLLLAATAEAKAPPTGKYDCTIGGSTLFGTLTIKRAGRYEHRGSKGTFTHGEKKKRFSDGIVGWTLRFKRGNLGGMRGRWYKASDGTPQGTYEIALRNPRDDFESIYCSKRK
jgi:hypothetical protein